jgi:hypothetical protein
MKKLIFYKIKDIIKKIELEQIMYSQNEGHVAQWTRACGYEPQSRGFESLLAQNKKDQIF